MKSEGSSRNHSVGIIFLLIKVGSVFHARDKQHVFLSSPPAAHLGPLAVRFEEIVDDVVALIHGGLGVGVHHVRELL